MGVPRGVPSSACLRNATSDNLPAGILPDNRFNATKAHDSTVQGSVLIDQKALHPPAGPPQEISPLPMPNKRSHREFAGRERKISGIVPMCISRKISKNASSKTCCVTASCWKYSCRDDGEGKIHYFFRLLVIGCFCLNMVTWGASCATLNSDRGCKPLSTVGGALQLHRGVKSWPVD